MCDSSARNVGPKVYTSDIAQEAYRLDKTLELYISEIFDYRNFSENYPKVDLSTLKDIVRKIRDKLRDARNEKRKASTGYSDPWYE